MQIMVEKLNEISYPQSEKVLIVQSLFLLGASKQNSLTHNSYINIHNTQRFC